MAEKKGYVATTKFLIASPTKVRPVANVVKKMSCSKALATLEVMPQKGAKLISSTLKSTAPRAEARFMGNSPPYPITSRTAAEPRAIQGRQA